MKKIILGCATAVAVAALTTGCATTQARETQLDMRPKTAYFAMDDLINREWKTKTTVKAEGGKVAFRGFRGKYRLTWTGADGKSASTLVEVK